MRIIEEQRLKNIINVINNNLDKSKTIISFYNNIHKIKIDSIQELSYEKNKQFFDDISFVLDAIIAIIAKPHIANKTEDIVMRSDIAGHISNEAFQMTFKEPSLWKEKNLEMVPEYVHHIQYNDDIRIYENIFIGLVIDLLSTEITLFLENFESRIPSIDASSLIIDENTKLEELLNYAKKLNRKIKYIKQTHFYKEVSKQSLKGKTIIPTNILTKDRLYNYCFKFYKKFIQYNNIENLLTDLQLYYKTIILQIFKEKKILLDQSKEQDSEKLNFIYNDFKINLNTENNYIALTISLKKNKTVTNLYIDASEEEQNNIIYGDDTLYIKLFNIIDLKTNKPIYINSQTEKAMFRNIIEDKTKYYKAKKELYSTYCPVCKSKNISITNTLYKCEDCHCEYVFKDKSTIWFKKMRRI